MECVYRKFETSRRFGVELEVGNEIKKPAIRRQIISVSNKSVYTSRYNLSTNNAYWHVKDDSTCGPKGKDGPKGVEIASFVASGLNDLNHICDVADHLVSKGVKTNENCGLHIHVDASDISIDQAGRILASWIKLEPFLALALPSRRIENPYCRMLYPKGMLLLDTGVSPKGVYEFLKPIDLAYYENNDRRVTLNFVNYCRGIFYSSNVRKTIELRWPEGTLSSTEIKNWVRLFLNFIEYAKDAPVPKSSVCPTVSEAMNLLGLGHSNKFTILSEGLLKTKIWLLERIINNPNLDFCMLMMGAPVVFVPNKDDCVKYLNFISSPVKKYS
jgi:hypothetical protein